MVKKIKLLKTINGIPAGTVGVCQGGGTRSTGGLTLRFDRSDVPEILTNVNADDVVGTVCDGLFECDLCDGFGNDGPDECPKCRGEGLASE